MSLPFVKKAQNTQNGFSYKKGRTSDSRAENCLGTALESGTVLNHFRATYSQKPISLKPAQSNWYFDAEFLPRTFGHS
jgi:hypothetical protein